MARVHRWTRWGIGLAILGAGLLCWRAWGPRMHGGSAGPATRDIAGVLTRQGLPVVPVAILGSGPAGLSAAVYSGRARLHTVVFQGPAQGGQLMETTYVENWPGMGKKLGPDLIRALEQQALQFGARFVPDTVTAIDWRAWPYTMTLMSGTKVQALSIIVATGSTPKKLNIPGEKEYFGKGVTACAVCDAAFFKDKKVVVVGGGDSAAEQVSQLASYAREIIMLVRGPHMRASKAMQERVARIPHVTIWYEAAPLEIKGDGKQVTGLVVKQRQETKEVPLDGVFLAIGHTPATELVKDAVKLNELGYIEVGCHGQQTSMPGVFAAGDVSDHQYRQAGVASGDGIKAALDAERFLLAHGYSDTLVHDKGATLYDPIHEKELVPLPELTSLEDFTEKVLHGSGLVIVDFFTGVCPSCKHIKPYVQSFAARYKTVAQVYVCDLDKVPELKKKYAITSVPTFLIAQDGLVIGHTKAPTKKQDIFDVLGAYLPEK